MAKRKSGRVVVRQDTGIMRPAPTPEEILERECQDAALRLERQLRRTNTGATAHGYLDGLDITPAGSRAIRDSLREDEAILNALAGLSHGAGDTTPRRRRSRLR